MEVFYATMAKKTDFYSERKETTTNQSKWMEGDIFIRMHSVRNHYSVLSWGGASTNHCYIFDPVLTKLVLVVAKVIFTLLRPVR